MPLPAAESTWFLRHGTQLTPEVWNEVGGLVGKSLPVRAPALPRLGTQANIAQRVLATIVGDNQAPLHVVGHSFGGQVATEVLAARQRLASLTIICSRATSFTPFATTAQSLRRGIAGTPPALRHAFRKATGARAP